MSPQPPQPVPESPLEGLQFEKAEFADTRPRCTACTSVIDSTYFHLSGQVICPTCAELAKSGQARPKNEWVLRGALYGVGAAVACSIVYAIITIVTHMELAIVSILVGYVIGRAVKTGSRGLGGRRCQVIAVTLTYLAITMSYLPLIIKSGMEQADKPRVQQQTSSSQSTPVPPKPAEPKLELTFGKFVMALAILSGISLIAPFLGLMEGFSGLIGLAIIFFGLSRAWTLTARDERLIMGPYTVEGSPASA